MVDAEQSASIYSEIKSLEAAIEMLASKFTPANPPHVIWLKHFAATTGLRTHITNQRMISETIVMSSSAVALVTLNVGTMAYTFRVAVGTNSVPFPIRIDRGVDLRITTTAADVDFYIIAQVEV